MSELGSVKRYQATICGGKTVIEILEHTGDCSEVSRNVVSQLGQLTTSERTSDDCPTVHEVNNG